MSSNIVKRQLGSDLQVNDHLINQWKIICGKKISLQDLEDVTYLGLNICHLQGQTKVATKWLKSLVGIDQNVKKNAKFYHHETKTKLTVCLNPNTDANLRFNSLYRCFMTFDDEEFNELPMVDKASLKASVLCGLAEIMSSLSKITTINELISSIVLTSQDKKDHLTKTFLQTSDQVRL